MTLMNPPAPPTDCFLFFCFMIGMKFTDMYGSQRIVFGNPLKCHLVSRACQRFHPVHPSSKISQHLFKEIVTLMIPRGGILGTLVILRLSF